jgi:hypothetical protein
MPEAAVDTSFLDVAQDWRRRGFSVVPVIPGSKLPLMKWRGLIDEPLTEDQINTVWARTPEANVGVIPGSGRALVVDPDLYKGGGVVEAWAEAIMQHGIDVPGAVVAETASGGLHIWMSWPQGVEHVTSAADSLGEGVDVKSSGGYVLVPGSVVDGRPYRWRQGQGIDDCPMLSVAPQSLVDMAGRGGAGGSIETEVDSLPAAGLAEAYKLTDGREKIMSRAVYAIGKALQEERGDVEDTQAWFDRAWERFVSQVREREGRTLAQDGRGPDDLWTKIRSTQAKLRSEMVRVPAEGVVETAATQAPGLSIVEFGAFADALRPMEYVIDGVVQRGQLMSMTGPTGHGKSAVALEMNRAVATGAQFGPFGVTRGRCLYLAGENPDDVRARCVAMREGMSEADLQAIQLHFLPATFPMEELIDRVIGMANAVGPFDMITVDTMAAFFGGDDDNHNVQAGHYARVLRRLTEIEGHPAVIVPAHPVKAASKFTLLPRGGGAFLNEVDGNLTIWSDDLVTTTLSHAGKLRGPGFAPISFELKVSTPAALVDVNGRQMPTVLARHVPEEQALINRLEAVSFEDLLMRDIRLHDVSPIRDRAERLGASKSAMHRAVISCKNQELIRDNGRGLGLELTPKGKRELDGKAAGDQGHQPVESFD